MRFFFLCILLTCVFSNLSIAQQTETIKAYKSSEKKDSQKVAQSPKEVKIDTFIWSDTLSYQGQKMVVRYTKIPGQALKRDTIFRDKKIETDVATNQITKERSNNSTVVVRNEKKKQYQIALVLSLGSLQYVPKTEIPASSVRSLEFYEGAKLAIDDFQKYNQAFKVKIFDCTNQDESIAAMRKDIMAFQPDLIVGPSSGKILEVLAQISDSLGVFLVSPFNNNKSVGALSAQYIQMVPSVNQLAKKISDLVKTDAFNNDYKSNYIILGSEEDSFVVNEIKKECTAIGYKGNMPSLISPVMSAGAVSNLVKANHHNVFIIPNETDETFVFACLRELTSIFGNQDEEKSKKVSVLGMNAWKFFERINLEYYNNLGIYYLENYFFDKKKPEVNRFEERYRVEYGISPRDFAYIGYNSMAIFMELLMKNGVNLHSPLESGILETESHIPLVPTFQFVKRNQVGGYENVKLELIQIQQYEPVLIKK